MIFGGKQQSVATEQKYTRGIVAMEIKEKDKK